MIRFEVVGTDRFDIHRKAAAVIKDYTGKHEVRIDVDGGLTLWDRGQNGAYVHQVGIDARPIMAMNSDHPIAWSARVSVDI